MAAVLVVPGADDGTFARLTGGAPVAPSPVTRGSPHRPQSEATRRRIPGMSVTTLCQICESATASHTCDACGAAVCTEHYDRGTGLCVSCAARARGDG